MTYHLLEGITTETTANQADKRRFSLLDGTSRRTLTTQAGWKDLDYCIYLYGRCLLHFLI